MKKTRNMFLIFLLIVIQSAIAISAGVAALCFLSQKTVPAGVFAGELPVGGMEYSKAAKAVETDYASKFNKNSIKLDTENGVFEIPYSQINARVDGIATLDKLRKIDDISDIPSLFNAYFNYEKPVLQPVIKLDEGKLREALMDLAEKIGVAPLDARIDLKDGTIAKKSETDGFSLNIPNAASLISKQIQADPWKPVQLKRAGNYELQTVQANIKIKDFEGIQQVLAEYSTDIPDDELTDSIKLAVSSINGVILPSKANGSDTQAFSFVKRLTSKNGNFENDNEGYDQVASTLYAALLSAGIPKDSITRSPHKLAVDYIEPGLDAWISGNACDLQFTNPFGHKLAILAAIEDGRVIVALAGDSADKKENNKVTTEITQRFEPPVFNVENDELKSGEKVVLSPGKEGVKVNVYRNGELFGTDQYEAEKAIVQIGPGTEWKNSGK